MAAPLRTPDSLIFNVRAGDLTSGVPRFAWSPAQENEFTIHVISHQEPNTKYDDLVRLIQRLDLHGYGAIVNADGVNVQTIINNKVRRKIRYHHSKLLNPQPMLIEPAPQLIPRPMAQVILPPLLPPMSRANAGPGNQYIHGYNINIIDPGSDSDDDIDLLRYGK